MTRMRTILAAMIGAGSVAGAAVGDPLHLTWHWHLEQPIYWPDQQQWGNDRAERAWESIVRTDGSENPGHPPNCSLDAPLNVERQPFSSTSRDNPGHGHADTDNPGHPSNRSLEGPINVEGQLFSPFSRAATLTRAVLSITTADAASIGPFLDALGAATAYRERRANRDNPGHPPNRSDDEPVNFEVPPFSPLSRAAPLTRAVLPINTAQPASIGAVLHTLGAATAYRERRVNRIV
jgi:hypothetical protein